MRESFPFRATRFSLAVVALLAGRIGGRDKARGRGDGRIMFLGFRCRSESLSYDIKITTTPYWQRHSWLCSHVVLGCTSAYSCWQLALLPVFRAIFSQRRPYRRHPFLPPAGLILLILPNACVYCARNAVCGWRSRQRARYV